MLDSWVMEWPATGFHWLDTSSRKWLREMTGLGPASPSSLPVSNSFTNLTFCLSSSVFFPSHRYILLLFSALWNQTSLLDINGHIYSYIYGYISDLMSFSFIFIEDRKYSELTHTEYLLFFTLDDLYIHRTYKICLT